MLAGEGSSEVHFVAFVCKAIALPQFTVVVFLEFAVYCSRSAVFFQTAAGLVARR